MNEEDAKKVIRILENADGGCPDCVNSLKDEFFFEFPQFKYLDVLTKE